MMEEECDLLCPPRCVSYLQARDPSILSFNTRAFPIKVRRNLADKFCSESTIVSSEKQISKRRLVVFANYSSKFSCAVEVEMDDSDESASSLKIDSDQGLSVYLRIKGDTPDNDLYTIQSNTLTCTVPEGSHAAKNKRDKTVVLKKFAFTNIFGRKSSQEEIFDAIIKEKVLNFINGNNSTLLTYGTSGSGKTFTMIGTEEQPGIIPRALDYLFRTLSESTKHEPILKPMVNGMVERLRALRVMQETARLQDILRNAPFAERNQHAKTYNEMQRRLSTNQVAILDAFPPIVNVWVSIAEIYNELIYDLLEPLPGRGQHRNKLKIGGLHDDTYIKGLKYIYVRSGLEAYQVLQYGLHNLSYAATTINQHSSRSHCIFSVRLIAGDDEKNCRLSVFNFCDLAGSERLKNTMNEGDRLKEATKINTSLSVLRRCIRSVIDIQQNLKDSGNIPFRESKLTQLFQKALQGKEDILMMVNINPSPDMFDDTQHTLNFSAIAKQILTREALPRILKPSRFSSYLQNVSMYLQQEHNEREEELQELRDHRARLVLQLSELQQQADLVLEEETTHLRRTYDSIIVIKDRQISNLHQELNEVKQAKNKLEKEKIQLHKELFNANQVVVISSEDEADTSIEDFDHKLRENNMLKQEITTLKTENKMLSNKCKELEETLRDAKEDFDKLMSEYEMFRSEMNIKNIMLGDQVDTLNEELEALRPRNLALTEELEKLEDQQQETCL